MRIDFSKPIDFLKKDKLECFLGDKKLVFLEYDKYEGPITLQLLPNGGIQSLFHGILIIQTKGAFMGVTKLIYQGKILSSDEFIKEVGPFNLMNQVLH